MRYFKVEGADAKTGEDRVVIVAAASEDDARQQARGMGVLASGVAIMTAETPAATSPGAAGTGAMPPRRRFENPPLMAALLSFFGVIVVLYGVVAVCVGITNAERFQDDFAPGAAANALEAIKPATIAGAALISGVLLLILGQLICINANIQRLASK